ncbi:NAD(P)/FAD-dependent oxidoreductase [Sphingomonas solaris]|uniref:Thioredoxin reductase n=1 Tax=Alterirhizorhabdus solaris TaxID=2529389 RepID=A0A558RAS3_9SPHN|nr:NAD(P)/FAD-dependent oxidoreductase [Sphingomonas solaris]TVV76458.1 NAD(P)/FAD-dependent oxidoreductase [Sphingomonas solaris]
MMDCLVIGGGPAGLTAAIYLARFHLSVVVVDEGKSRAALIPKTRNHAGYPAGIAGTELLARMREQAELYGAQIVPGRIDQLTLEAGVFTAKMSGSRLQARSVLLATGIINRRPNMTDALHDEALAVGALRYCPVCDGFEVTDRTIGVIGSGERGTNEALFLRSYSKQITLIAPMGRHDLADEQRKKLQDAAVEVVDGPVGRFDLDDRRLSVRIGSNRHTFDSIYPALGSDIRSGLAVSVGAEATEEGCLTVDSHQRTTVSGLYAAGDVVLGLDQISHAMGEGGVAATTIRNDLASDRPLYR